MESGPIKKSGPVGRQTGPTPKDKAALKAVLDLLPPKLPTHLDKLGLEVIATSLVASGGRLVARITIDKLPSAVGEESGGVQAQGTGSLVTIDDCTKVSRIISALLDELDPGPGPEYSLEVSSPGLDRPLLTMADYKRFTGSLAKVKLGTGRHTGRLAIEPLRLITSQGEILFSLDEVVSARLVPEI